MASHVGPDNASLSSDRGPTVSWIVTHLYVARFMTNMKDDLEGLSLLKILEEKETPEPYFTGMFPVHACLNHSCNNNAEVSNGVLNGHFGIQVTAKRDIKKGEEVGACRWCPPPPSPPFSSSSPPFL